jgi:CobQ-like glutamine amidotransferase family enzyme
VNAVRIGVLFPSTFNLNGDTANATVLARRLELSGVPIQIVACDADAMGTSATVDALVIGSPSSTALLAAQTGSDTVRGFIESARRDDVPILAISNGFHLLGTMKHEGGNDLGGLGLIPVRTTFGTRQYVTIGARVSTEWGNLVGVENHNATVELAGDAEPLGRISHGVGNNSGGFEGFRDATIWASHLHGPLFAMNPEFADAFAAQVMARRGGTYERSSDLDKIDILAHRAAAHLVRKQSA